MSNDGPWVITVGGEPLNIWELKSGEVNTED